jgi:hypothetical protein
MSKNNNLVFVLSIILLISLFFVTKKEAFSFGVYDPTKPDTKSSDMPNQTDGTIINAEKILYRIISTMEPSVITDNLTELLFLLQSI